MIFKETWQQVLDGTKTQTRRPVKPGEYPKIIGPGLGYPEYPGAIPGTVLEVRRINGYLKWRVGHTYAVQPGRGKKAVGRIRITKIRRERLQEITHRDAMAEGIKLKATQDPVMEAIRHFADLWNSLYRHPYRWEDNPEAWALHIERVK